MTGLRQPQAVCRARGPRHLPAHVGGRPGRPHRGARRLRLLPHRPRDVPTTSATPSALPHRARLFLGAPLSPCTMCGPGTRRPSTTCLLLSVTVCYCGTGTRRTSLRSSRRTSTWPASTGWARARVGRCGTAPLPSLRSTGEHHTCPPPLHLPLSYHQGFFRGVSTVVAKLLNILQPTSVFFGQKDGLQVVTHITIYGRAAGVRTPPPTRAEAGARWLHV